MTAHPDESLSRAPRALAWSLLNALASRLGTLAIGIAMARMLGPEQFGIYAVAFIALVAALSFNELGVSLAIVRWDGDPEAIANTVTTISVTASVLIAGLMWLVAPGFASAMGEPDATPVVRVLSLSIIISGVVATPAALLQRAFRQRTRMLIDQVNVWGGALTSLGLAIAGAGAMSLAVGRLLGAFISGIMFLRCSPLPTRLGWDRRQGRNLLHFGLPLAGASILVFILGYVDQAMVGHLLGATALGYYVLAANLSGWPISVFSVPLRSVAPAVFARMRFDDRSGRSLVALSGLLGAVTFPVCFLLAGGARPIVGFVYGEAWLPAADVLIWLGLFAAVKILFELFYDYAVVVGKSSGIFRIQVAMLVISIPAIYLGALSWGAPGVAAAQLAGSGLLLLPAYLVYLGRLGVPSVDVLRSLLLPAAMSLAAGGIGLYISATVPARPTAALACGGIAVVAAGLGLLCQKDKIARLRSAMEPPRTTS